MVQSSVLRAVSTLANIAKTSLLTTRVIPNSATQYGLARGTLERPQEAFKFIVQL